jgi:hypothetical protein
MEQTRATLEVSKQEQSFESQRMHIVAATQFTLRQRDLLQRKMAMESSDKARLRLCAKLAMFEYLLCYDSKWGEGRY